MNVVRNVKKNILKGVLIANKLNRRKNKMYGIELKSGINDCYFNCEGKCVNKNITRRKTIMSCDWDSKSK